MNKWPKILSSLSQEQQLISNKFMQLWHEELANKKSYRFIENFNQHYAIKHKPDKFLRTLEIGAGLGEHLKYEKLDDDQKQNYHALELRENMANEIKKKYSYISTHVGDCQSELDFHDNYFDRILAIHILEHLPNLPAALKEMHRLCNKQYGYFSVVIPCEGGLMYSIARKLSAQRYFEKTYQQPYDWFIEREHINKPHEIIVELRKYFQIQHQSFFPFFLPSIHLNLCIGLTLRPKEKAI